MVVQATEDEWSPIAKKSESPKNPKDLKDQVMYIPILRLAQNKDARVNVVVMNKEIKYMRVLTSGFSVYVEQTDGRGASKSPNSDGAIIRQLPSWIANEAPEEIETVNDEETAQAFDNCMDDMIKGKAQDKKGANDKKNSEVHSNTSQGVAVGGHRGAEKRVIACLCNCWQSFPLSSTPA
jgi:hypothetical protein